MSSTVASIYWWTLWGAAAGAVLVWRVGLPLHRTLTHRIRVVDVVRESDDVVSVVMTGRRLDRLHVAAGQFLLWRFLDAPGWTRGSPLLALGRSDRRTLCASRSRTSATPAAAWRTSRRGPASPSRAPTAGCTWASGPVARCCCWPAGSGSPRCAGCSRRCPQEPGDVTLVYRASHDGDLILRDEIEALADARGARVFYAVGPRVADRHSWLPQAAAGTSDEDALRQLVPDLTEGEVRRLRLRCRRLDGRRRAGPRRGRGSRRRDPHRAVQLVRGTGMRRIAVALMGTVSGLVLLFSYHTSRNEGSVAVSASAPGGRRAPPDPPGPPGQPRRRRRRPLQRTPPAPTPATRS